MNLPSDFKAALNEGNAAFARGQFLEAERIYRSLAEPGDYRAIGLEALANLFVQQVRYDEALKTLRQLTREDRDNLQFSTQLANLFEKVGNPTAAINEYERILRRQPDLEIAHFNVARLYGRVNRYSEAIASYNKAVKLGIDHVEEVCSNMGVLYSEMEEPDQAQEMFERALEIAPDYIDGIFNFAGHLEEIGDKDRALDYYERIQELDPGHWDSLARLAYPRAVTDETRGIVEKLEMAIQVARRDNMTTERLYFALGKACDDLERYDKAAGAYAAANELGKARVVPYDSAMTEAAFSRLIELFDTDWIREKTGSSTAAPIFICGMFRSGSTLLEQMLGAHPVVTAGGEFDFLPRLVGSELAPYPRGMHEASTEKLQSVGKLYLSRVSERFPEFERVTDKRPDNFLHLGLIKAMFPKSKIIHTRRGLLDNCLSLYFQQLGNNFSYATDLRNCAHYYQQQERLMDHWKSCVGEDIFAVDYEEIVEAPEPAMRKLLEFLGLEWDPQVLEFHKSRSTVKTPSLWQVRQGLYKGSSGRWRNYESLLGSLVELAPSDETPG